MKTTLAAKIIEGESISDVFLISRKDVRETKHGKLYMALGLSDRSGRIEARVWERADRYANAIAVGDYVLVEARAESFKGEIQLNVTSLTRQDPNAVDRSQFLPSTGEDIERLYSEMLKIIDTIQDEQLRALVRAIVTDGEVARRLRRSPAAQSVHHAKLGGLLQHTMSMLLMGLRYAEHYQMLDREMLIAGVVLHDLGKLDELSYDSAFEFTDRGRLLGHISMGLERLDSAAAEHKIDPLRLDQLRHILLSHHGEREFGSPVLPATPEALVVHFLDNVDSKLNIMSNQIESEIHAPGGFTSYNRYMARSFLKGPLEGFKPYGVRWPWPRSESEDATKSARTRKADASTPSLFDKQD
ncbi:MAG: OB-fold nucleic acid binding domain-containing protein [Candidatus Alcyoniella australis]|nr:OB-fold nucleic acid binding domain-containing protein [Candidatus Alcyoniella australis]